MKNRDQGKTPSGKITSEDFLAAVPYANRAVSLKRSGDGSALAEIPMNRPRWLVPPLSWVLPFSSHRRLQLDELGVSVFDLCNGKNPVETIIEKFANKNKLSFREAQIPVTQFLQQMSQRGLVAIVGLEKETDQS